jgi:ubiquinone/menaquinone biosynthesis C-methylase UbiE
MRWDTLEHDLHRRIAVAPGGSGLADALIDSLHIEPGQKVLDLCPGTGVLASMVAREHRADVTCITTVAKLEAATEATAAALGVSDRVRIFPGSPATLPFPSDEFDRIYCLGQPWTVQSSHQVIMEIYRVLKPDGMFGIAGPSAIVNKHPDYMKAALKHVEGAMLKTPAYAALMFAQEGFHIIVAEFFAESYEHWKEWLKNAPPEAVPDDFRRAVIQDEGKWLALGLIVLRKPPRPDWAV